MRANNSTRFAASGGLFTLHTSSSTRLRRKLRGRTRIGVILIFKFNFFDEQYLLTITNTLDAQVSLIFGNQVELYNDQKKKKKKFISRKSCMRVFAAGGEGKNSGALEPELGGCALSRPRCCEPVPAKREYWLYCEAPHKTKRARIIWYNMYTGILCLRHLVGSLLGLQLSARRILCFIYELDARCISKPKRFALFLYCEISPRATLFGRRSCV